jgi:hypothetical protein
MNFIQQSIQRTREKLREFNRVKATITKQVRDDTERKNTMLEQVIDEVCFHTGLRCENPEDISAIRLHTEQVLLEARRRKAEEDEPQWNPDEWSK